MIVRISAGVIVERNPYYLLLKRLTVHVDHRLKEIAFDTKKANESIMRRS